jgi:hypothetical protein
LAGVKARLTAAAALPDSVNVTEPIPLALATTRLVPAMVPTVKLVEAIPVLSVIALAGVTLPPPVLTVKLTRAC